MIRRIRLQHFRSYNDATFEFGDGVNVIVGPNASGKTNLVEAVAVCARGNSFRAKDIELPAIDAEWARLDGSISQEGVAERVVKFTKAPTGGWRKSFEIDGRSFQRLSVQRSIPAVIFEPEHLRLLSGGPGLRRDFLDDIACQLVPGFSPVLGHYRRALAQRNALLKQGERIAAPNLFVWNLRLSELGGRIAQERQTVLKRINELLPAIHCELAGHDEPVVVTYQSGCDVTQYESSMLGRLEASATRDCAIGFTTTGPHRDEITASLRGQPVESTASRGEQRTIVLALKIIELRLLHELIGTAPIMLLDDVFSELDSARRQALTKYLDSYQTFITTTDADVAMRGSGIAFRTIAINQLST